MGGLSKHMMHPYDDVMMPINNLCDIIEKSIMGELVFTEKLDGYNIHASFVDGKARFFRNGKDIQTNGMTIEELKYKYNGSPKQLGVFTDAAEKISLFFKDLDEDLIHDNCIVTFNCECIFGDLSAPTNIMPYTSQDNKVYLHNIWEWNKDTGEVVKIHNIDKTSLNTYFYNKISYALRKNQNIISLTPTIPYRCISPERHYDEYYVELFTSMLLEIVGDSVSLYDFYKNEFAKFIIQYKHPHGEMLYDNIDGFNGLFDDLFERLFLNNTSIGKKYLAQTYNLAKEEINGLLNDNNIKTFIRQTKSKIEDVFRAIGDYILENCTFYINYNCRYLVGDLIMNRVNNILAYKNPDDKAFEYYNRLSGNNMRINALEGVTFEYNNNLYKWTGSFSLINKLIWS